MSKFPKIALCATGGTALFLGLAAVGTGSVSGLDSVSFSDAITAPFLSAATAEENPQNTGFALGRVALPEEVAAWDQDVRPDGKGLPAGKGDVLTGEEIFADSCAMCHGDFGEGVGRWPVLAGGVDTLDSERPVKTIGSYWPYLSTVYDYINRAMPFGNARSLAPDEIYAITAYLLYVNDLVEEDFELSKENFTEVKLPNEGNFFPDDRLEVEYPLFSAEVCMSDCKDSVEITGRAAIVDVTPDDVAAREAREAAAAEIQASAQDALVTGAAIEAVAEVKAETEQVTPEAVSVDPAQVAKGAKLFKKCKACHQVGDGAKNRTGPQLNNLMGRVAGSGEGFRYSKAFKNAQQDGLVWQDETLAAFLAKPKAYLKGTKMSFSGFKKEADVAAMIAYLRSFDQ
ncbi:c-type cytochrome [Candidatus Halocynthiibacter alkanivorans]|uniref:c-type cytochrome n=1 Tax=Candidatus Halocynthiibacter alkanivorans TaxID=2267619 RepID=UPI000DF2E524|nr:c-type cytochrome [Candidatus Halocynthiibacter alkanivorans]